jgi:hypothetical protein
MNMPRWEDEKKTSRPHRPLEIKLIRRLSCLTIEMPHSALTPFFTNGYGGQGGHPSDGGESHKITSSGGALEQRDGFVDGISNVNVAC